MKVGELIAHLQDVSEDLEVLMVTDGQEAPDVGQVSLVPTFGAGGAQGSAVVLRPPPPRGVRGYVDYTNAPEDADERAAVLRDLRNTLYREPMQPSEQWQRALRLVDELLMGEACF